jgi:beta-barrel assembly-enhancing protease
MNHRLHKFGASVASLVVLLGSLPAPAQDSKLPLGPAVSSTLPDLGSSANALLSREDEYQIGRMVMHNLRNEGRLLEDPETVEYLQSLGSRIGVEAQDGEHRLTFFAVRDSSVNAFALPGGFIGINTGLITLTDAESELAGVTAHEIGHVTQRHLARAVQAQGRTGLTAMAAQLGAILIGAMTGSTEAAIGLISMAQGTAMQQQINFTRMEEHEADRVGISYLAAAGFDPSGMAGFFTTMMRERGTSGDDIPSLLLSHPVDSLRIAEARARIASMPNFPRKPESLSYELIRERLRVIASTPDSDLRRYYEHALKNDSKRLSLRYGAALAEIKSGDPKAAVTALKPLIKSHPELNLLHSALAQAQLAAEQPNDAIATFEHGLQLTPRSVPLTVHYAEALLTLNQASKAHQLLLDLFNNTPPTPEQIRLTALAASAAGDSGDAYYYMSEYHIASGDPMLAITQLDLALAAPNLTGVQRKRFLARRDEIRNALREQRGDRRLRESPPA